MSLMWAEWMKSPVSHPLGNRCVGGIGGHMARGKDGTRLSLLGLQESLRLQSREEASLDTSIQGGGNQLCAIEHVS